MDSGIDPSPDTTAASSAAATPATSVAPSTAGGASSVRLPLAVRKSIRDDWETKRPGFEAKISDLLGVPWTIPIDYATLYPFAENVIAKENPGTMISEYIASTVENIQRFVEDYGDEGKAELNQLAYSHTILIAPTSDPKITYSSCDIVDGSLRNVFAKSCLGTNVLDATSDIASAINIASSAAGATSPLDFIARSNIKRVWDPKADELQSQFCTILACPVITLTPNFERNAAALERFDKANKKTKYPLREDWLSRIGEWTLEYFEGAKDTLEYKGFDKDDMLQEGFKDVIEKNEIELRVVEKLVKGSYNEVVVENGVLIIQTLPETWMANIGDAAENILDVL